MHHARVPLHREEASLASGSRHIGQRMLGNSAGEERSRLCPLYVLIDKVDADGRKEEESTTKE